MSVELHPEARRSRRDGSSLFGSGRISGPTTAAVRLGMARSRRALRLLEEHDQRLHKLRAAVAMAGKPPESFSQQYQTFNVTNGTVSAQTLGNVNLRPELSTEVELGFDAEILHKYGL